MTRRRGAADAQLGLDGEGFELLAEPQTLKRAGELRHVDPREIGPNPAQPRAVFEDERLRELAESFRAVGVLQPLLAREAPDGSLHLIAGERRQRAAILAGLERVPVRLLAVSERVAAAITLTENLAREDLSPWEEAIGLARLRDSLAEQQGTPPTRDELAKMVGRSGGAVSESLRIADCLSPLIPRAGVTGQTLTKLPKTALLGATRGRTAEEMLALLRLSIGRLTGGGAPGRAMAGVQNKRGRPPKGWTVSDRLKDRGTLLFRLRKRPEELAPEEARDALARLTPLIEALRARTDGPGGAERTS